jgi:hypothetical protein
LGGEEGGLVPSNKSLENILKMTEVGRLCLPKIDFLTLRPLLQFSFLSHYSPLSVAAEIWVGGGSDTGTWWLRCGDVVAQIRGRGGSDTGMWRLRYGDVEAQILGRGGLDKGAFLWLRSGDVVAQIQ